MKKLALASAIALTATGAFAGGIAEPVMEPEVVEAKAGTSSAGIIIPILLLILIAAAVASDDGGGN
jgi:hypothetical protein